MASSASKSYHSNGAELGDGSEAARVNGERSSRSSGELARNWESTCPAVAVLEAGNEKLAEELPADEALCCGTLLSLDRTPS